MKNYEFSFGGLIFGADHPIGLTEIDGLDPPDIRVLNVENPGDHGAYIYAKFLYERTITFSGDVIADHPKAFNKHIQHLKRAFHPRALDAPLKFRFPGAEIRFVNCKPSKTDYPVNFMYGLSFGEWSAELIAGDPRIYGHSLQRQDFNSGDVFSITNAGNFQTWPIVTFHAPITNPKIIDVKSGDFVLLNTTLTATQKRVINFQDKTILDGAGDNKYEEFDQSSTWWDIGAGTHKLKFEASSGTGFTRVQWRNTWI